MASENSENKTQLSSTILLGIAVLLAVVTVLKVVSSLTVPAKARSIVDKAVEQAKLDASNIEKFLADSKALAEEIKKNNLIAPPPPKQNPVKEVQGILGNEVLINGKFYKNGDKIGDAEIVAIEATQVRIRWNGQEKSFAPIDSGGASGPQAEPARASRGEISGRRSPEMVVIGSEGPPSAGSRSPMPIGEGRFGPPSPEQRERMRERFRNMSEEERQQMRERFRNMSEEERRAFREQMRERGRR